VTAEKTIAFVLYPNLAALDLIGPLQVLQTFARLVPGYRVVVVGERAEEMGTDVGVGMVPDKTFAEVPHPDIVVVPGGRVPTIRAMSDPVMRAYVRAAASTAEVVASVCTGSLILGALGLLEGRRATTNWFFTRLLEKFDVLYEEERWVEDDRFVTSAGVSAGIDMALHLVSRLTDEATARRVQLALDYDPAPPFGNLDWAKLPRAPRIVKGVVGLAAPLLAAKPKRMTREDRRAAVLSPPAWRREEP
jgi:transcriptional regulator GlxA family with amidase domain